MNQLSELYLTAFGLILVGFIFWPKSGFFWRWKRGLRSTERVLIEDSLKHLYDLEYKDVKATLQSIAGSLSISVDKAAKLMARLEALGLVKTQEETFQLTPQGRSYALKMIRVHRLWERYLADETGLEEIEWHRQAEKKEHTLTEDEVETLAEKIGNPRFDPHGDPIPTASGNLPPKRGSALTDLLEGALARVIHIEDEPNVIFAQLVAEGLHPGMQIRMIQKTAKRLTFAADGDEIVLAPVMAANITVVPLPREEFQEEPDRLLTSLKIGEKAEVTGLSVKCRGSQRRRLMDLGITPGTVISAEMRSASGDPTAYLIRGATFGLRNQQAQMIKIRRLNGKEKVS